MRRKTFTHEFKQECVNLVLQHKYPVTQAAETMNIGLSTLQRRNGQARPFRQLNSQPAFSRPAVTHD